MTESLAAHRYARAIFKLADSHGKLEHAERDLLFACEIIKEHPEIPRLIANPTIAKIKKETLLEQVFAPSISELVLRFFKVLVRKGRFRELSSIQKEHHRLFEKKMGIQEVTVVSAACLSENNQNRLETVLKEKLRSEIRLIPKVDPSLIGGLILKFDGTEIDGSYKNRLERIKQKLLASYEGN